MRSIFKIIIHCSSSNIKENDDIGVIKKWHLQRGFIDVGYHFFIKRDGTVQTGRPVEQMGAHCKNHNSDSIGICLSGENMFTEKQYLALSKLLVFLMKDYELTTENIFSHHFFDKNKTCPNFNVKIFINRYVKKKPIL